MLDHPFSTTFERCLESAVETRICHRGSQFRKTKKFAVIRGFFFFHVGQLGNNKSFDTRLQYYFFSSLNVFPHHIFIGNGLRMQAPYSLEFVVKKNSPSVFSLRAFQIAYRKQF